MDLDKLKQKNGERIEEQARMAARYLINPEGLEARVHARETELARRHEEAVTKIDAVIDLVDADRTRSISIELGTDDRGYRLYAVAPYGTYRSVDFYAQNPNETSDTWRLGNTEIKDRFAEDMSSTSVIFTVGTARWNSSSALPIDDFTKAATLEIAEEAIADYEGTAAMLWGAATDSTLNPELADRVALLQQA